MGSLINYLASDELTFERFDSYLNFDSYVEFLKQELFWKEYTKVSKAFSWKLIEDDYGHGVPDMNVVFYNLYKARGIPPSCKMFMEEYKSHFVVSSDTPGKYKFSDYHYKHGKRKHCEYESTMPQIDRKLFNGYMGFLKEGYVIHWFWENGFPMAYYSYEYDKLGSDINYRHPKNNFLYCQRIYCKTDRSQAMVNVKDEGRVKLPDDAVQIKFEIDMSKKKGYMIGDTYVAPIEAMQAVAAFIRAGSKSNIHILSSDTVDTQNMGIEGGTQ